MKLLVVEDNQELTEDVCTFFREDGFVTEAAYTIQQAREKVGVYSYDLVILDLGLPDGNGLDLIGEIRQQHEGTAILVLTARDSIDTKVQGLEQGADDYLTKPFHKAELNARVHSILCRRISGGSHQIQLNELTVDLSARKAITFLQSQTPHLNEIEVFFKCGA